MTASPYLPRPDRAAAALCTLLGSPEDLRQPGVREAAERARDLLRSGADAGELADCYAALDTALRRSGDARGLAGGSRSVTAPGVAPHIKVAVCPGSPLCARVERARDLLPAPHCAVHGTRMRKSRLGSAQ
ncbi:hypothetical protein ACPCIX_03745 [Streptomyces pseudogriseolus]|uniref:Uncharacterized protein n=1 Tax=Streptomyces gancidicus BKS 13-15 TaxID=1284664 RepID=M3EAF6_STREZ|nr:MULTISPECIES: hypothetical protein [Streptomyces]EMF30116.1 hypothetical protein H114_05784 [Streptomyces gancidicus BKS 13-15]MCI4145882.1 hypothetical protein [Streptomyces sp. MMS20-AI2-20]GGQ00179.1 hypothetical protein GCM10010233_15970 [Streptomyces gancidicus]